MSNNTTPFHYAELSAAIETVITVLHQYQRENRNTNIRIAVIGGLAVRHYLGPDRTTLDADILVTGLDTTHGIKELVKGSTAIFCSDRAELQVAVRCSSKSIDLIPEKVLRPFGNMPPDFIPSSTIPVTDAVTPG
ncbi:hypothetical protein N8T08_007719 [Aspergillus melleus]|uniref:Uncharacterized protein n=1 Tax=Aspergillus melleus TaxID=138277 RepID=A0ACC3BEZ4_9EURO|nr:hypothetical protein N8T08_007719 [Aspergillus melleus]